MSPTLYYTAATCYAIGYFIGWIITAAIRFTRGFILGIRPTLSWREKP